MISCKRITFFVFFLGFLVCHIFTQNIPSRMDIPKWAKMGLTVTVASSNVPNGVLLPPRPGENDGNYHSYMVGENDL